jgi:hypothetical protein
MKELFISISEYMIKCMNELKIYDDLIKLYELRYVYYLR